MTKGAAAEEEAENAVKRDHEGAEKKTTSRESQTCERAAVTILLGLT